MVAATECLKAAAVPAPGVDPAAVAAKFDIVLADALAIAFFANERAGGRDRDLSAGRSLRFTVEIAATGRGPDEWVGPVFLRAPGPGALRRVAVIGVDGRPSRALGADGPAAEINGIELIAATAAVAGIGVEWRCSRLDVRAALGRVENRLPGFTAELEGCL